MSQQWYYRIGSREDGPISVRELKELASNGRLTPTDGVRTSPQHRWTPAGNVRGLSFGSAPVSNQPAATPSPQPADDLKRTSAPKTASPRPPEPMAAPNTRVKRVESVNGIQFLYFKNGEPVAAFVDRRIDDCLRITDQTILKLMATSIKIHAWANVRVGDVKFRTVLAIQTLPLKSPQLEVVPLIPLRAPEFEYLDGPRDFFEKVHIIGDSDNDRTSRKFIRPGFYYSARFGHGTIVSFKGKIWIVPMKREDRFIRELKQKGAAAFEDLESFEDPTLPYLDKKFIVNIPGDIPPNTTSRLDDDSDDLLGNSDNRVSTTALAVIAGILILLVGLGLGIFFYTPSPRIPTVSLPSRPSVPQPENIPNTAEPLPPRTDGPGSGLGEPSSQSPIQPSPGPPVPVSTVAKLIERIDELTKDDLQHYERSRQEFLKDPSTFNGILFLGTLPILDDQILAIKNAGDEEVAVNQLREVLSSRIGSPKFSDYFACLLMVQSLRDLGPHAKSAIPELQVLVQNQDPILRGLATTTLEQFQGLPTQPIDQAPVLTFEQSLTEGRVQWEPVRNIEVTTFTPTGSTTESFNFQVRLQYDEFGRATVDDSGVKRYDWQDRSAVFGPQAVIRITAELKVVEGDLSTGDLWVWTGEHWAPTDDDLPQNEEPLEREPPEPPALARRLLTIPGDDQEMVEWLAEWRKHLQIGFLQGNLVEALVISNRTPCEIAVVPEARLFPFYAACATPNCITALAVAGSFRTACAPGTCAKTHSLHK